MKIILPDSNIAGLPCVYKISFPDGFFYVGSTKNLAQRVYGYKSAFKSQRATINMLISDKINKFDEVLFIVLEEIPSGEPVRPYEDKWLKLLWDDEKILNRSRSAFSNLGMTKNRLNKCLKK